jgi:hypothetical protein
LEGVVIVITLKELILLSDQPQETKEALIRQIPTMPAEKKEALELMCWTDLKLDYQSKEDAIRNTPAGSLAKAYSAYVK